MDALGTESSYDCPLANQFQRVALSQMEHVDLSTATFQQRLKGRPFLLEVRPTITKTMPSTSCATIRIVRSVYGVLNNSAVSSAGAPFANIHLGFNESQIA